MAIINEKLTLGDRYYFIDINTYADNRGNISVTIIGGAGTRETWAKIGNEVFKPIPYMPLLPLEISDAISIYVENSGFAGLTVVEYLRDLGLTQ
jgi:hypothetical protein